MEADPDPCLVRTFLCYHTYINSCPADGPLRSCDLDLWVQVHGRWQQQNPDDDSCWFLGDLRSQQGSDGLVGEVPSELGRNLQPQTGHCDRTISGGGKRDCCCSSSHQQDGVRSHP